MKLHVVVSPYRRKLAHALPSAHGLVVEREGSILTLATTDGLEGKGEAAPISWIDGETAADAARDLARLGDSLVVADSVVRGDDASRRAWLREIAGELSASARAAIDAASLDLAARVAGHSACERLGGRAHVVVPFNALVVEATADAVGAAVRARIVQGYRTVKLKVGAAAPTVDLARVRAARGALGGDARLRLDANAAWSFDVASELLRAVGPDRIEYVEEPLAHATPADLIRLSRSAGVRIALDESFEKLGGVEGISATDCVAAVVLKPARIGGPTAAVELGRRLARSGITVVLTDAIETAVGRAAVVHAAAALASNGTVAAVGLGGLELLVGDASCTDPAGAQTTYCASGPGLAVTATRDR